MPDPPPPGHSGALRALALSCLVAACLLGPVAADSDNDAQGVANNIVGLLAFFLLIIGCVYACRYCKNSGNYGSIQGEFR